MSSPGTITFRIHRHKAGDAAACGELWEPYYRRLVGLARARLQGVARRAADEEDVALSAFDSFYRAAEAGRFPRLEDRDDLWQVLLMITSRKAADLREREGRQKRGGGRVQNVSALEGGAEDSAEGPPLEGVGRETDPALAAELADECRRLLLALESPELQQVAVWKMEGRTNAEISGLLGRTEGTVERKLQVIRRIWEEAGAG
jgi:DNA-directed RNA polymerase specialized sigma24 family protein